MARSDDDDGDRTRRERPAAVGFTPEHNDGERPSLGIPTVLREMGRNAPPLTLSRARKRLLLGAAAAPDVDVTLDGDGVSRLHALLTRVDNKIRVRDQESTNGTFFRGARDMDFQVGVGDTFQVTQRITLLVLDDELEALRDTLQWTLGLHADVAIDDALHAIANDQKGVLLLGEPGCDQRALAEEIHARSVRRGRDLVEAPAVFATREEQRTKLDHAARSTLYLDLVGADVFPHRFFVAGLFGKLPPEESPPPPPRPIVAARDIDHARELLGEANVQTMHVVTIPALSARREDIPTLLDALLLHESVDRQEKAPPRLAAKLDAESIEGLRACDWNLSEEGDNLDALRKRAVPRLYALLKNDMQLGPAGRDLGLSPKSATTTLRQALLRMGVQVRQVQEHDDADELDAERDPSEPTADPPLPRPPGGRRDP